MSLITLLSMLKIWNAIFVAPPRTDTDARTDTTAAPDNGGATGTGQRLLTARQTRVKTTLVMPAMILATITLGLGLGGEVLLDLASTAADGLLDTTSYIDAVIR